MVLDLNFDPPQEDDAGLPEDEQDLCNMVKIRVRRWFSISTEESIR
jgi:hypothetical protein